MPSRLEISQIFIPNHKQATNFVSLYEEVMRNDQPVSLFCIVEIRGDKKFQTAKKREEFEKITKSMVSNLKQTYLAEEIISEDTFEKALSSLNNTLSNLARHGVVAWYKHLNALVAAVAGDNLMISMTGSMSALLLRHNEFSQICPDNPTHTPHPLKTFPDFSTGELAEGDYIVLSAKSLYNYLSLERLRRLLRDEGLASSSKKIINTLKSDSQPADSFAAIVCAFSSKLAIADEELQPLVTPTNRNIIEDSEIFDLSKRQHYLNKLAEFLALIGAWIFARAKTMLQKAIGAFRITRPGGTETRTENMPKPKLPGSKKQYLAAFLLLVALLLINLIFSNFRNAQKRTEQSMKQLLDQTTQNITEAEAALIYNNEKAALEAIVAAEKSLPELEKSKLFPKETALLSEKIKTLSDQLNKISAVTNIEELGNFQQTPDQLIKTPSGFMGFNSYTDSFETFDQNTRAVEIVALPAPAPENLIAGTYFPPAQSLIFLSNNGHFFQLNTSMGQLTPMFATSTAAAANYDFAGLRLYDNKIYSVDKSSKQIMRFSQTKPGSLNFGEAWLKQPADLANASDLALDGSIYVLSNGAVIKFAKGLPQPFSLPSLSQAIDAKKIFTDKTYQYLYLADQKNSRILVLNKQGGLVKQLTSEKFSDLKDIFIDEAAKLIYGISGNALIRFKF
ncbi:MAG: hypothetical protein Q8N81_00835 [bacterium]|nr:hypothetical protein [bacterium]